MGMKKRNDDRTKREDLNSFRQLLLTMALEFVCDDAIAYYTTQNKGEIEIERCEMKTVNDGALLK